jgi:glyoxylase-like metal-dependent hydrolase (beta-lactamase superfamily II)
MSLRRLSVRLLKVGSCRHLECIALQGGRFHPITFPALAALILHPDSGATLFDTGYADHFLAATAAFPQRLYRWTTPISLPAHEQLARQLEREGCSLRDVRACIVSHFHADHVAGLKDLPNAAIIAMRTGFHDMRRGGSWGQLLRGALPHLLPADIEGRMRFAEDLPAVPLPKPWDGLGHGHDLLGDGSLVGVPLPGHSVGHMGVLFRDEQDRSVLLAADAAWSSIALHEKRMPSWLVRPLFDSWSAYRGTLATLHDVVTRHTELVVLPSHCGHALARYGGGWSES